MPLRTAEEGSDTAVWLALTNDNAVLSSSGAMFFDRAVAPNDYGGWMSGTASSAEDIAKLEAYLSQCKSREEAALSQQTIQAK